MTGILRGLARLASRLADDDTLRTRAEGDPGTRISYGVSIDSIRKNPSRPRRGEVSEQSRSGQDGRERRTRPRPQRYLTDTRQEDGDAVVTVDLPDVAADDLSLARVPATNEIVIRDGDDPVKRFELDWGGEVTDASFTNGVLQFRIEGVPQNG